MDGVRGRGPVKSANAHTYGLGLGVGVSEVLRLQISRGLPEATSVQLCHVVIYFSINKLSTLFDGHCSSNAVR